MTSCCEKKLSERRDPGENSVLAINDMNHIMMGRSLVHQATMDEDGHDGEEVEVREE